MPNSVAFCNPPLTTESAGYLRVAARHTRRVEIFDEVLNEICSGKISIGATEAQDNTWSVSLSAEQVTSTSPDEVAMFLDQVKAAYASVATDDQRVVPLRFYAWFDEMAGQLRFSISSLDPLPFGAVIRFVSNAHEIASQFLTSDYLSGIPWSELQEVDCDDKPDSETDADVAPAPLDVYVTNLFED